MTQSAKCCSSVSNNLANAPNHEGAPMKKHEDVKKDKAVMQKAVNKHESRLHKGEPKTKLAKGGMAMKGKGVAKRGCN
jgi:hypothetical protein